jgi:hypothetical protein
MVVVRKAGENTPCCRTCLRSLRQDSYEKVLLISGVLIVAFGTGPHLDVAALRRSVKQPLGNNVILCLGLRVTAVDARQLVPLVRCYQIQRRVRVHGYYFDQSSVLVNAGTLAPGMFGSTSLLTGS